MSRRDGRGGFRDDISFILAGEWRSVALISLLSIVTAVAEAFVLASIIQSIAVLASGRTSVDVSLLGVTVTLGTVTLLSMALAAALLRAGTTSLTSVLGPRVAARSRERQRKRLLRSFLEADWSTQASDRAGRFSQTFSTSINDANTPTLVLTQAVPAAITGVVLIGAAVSISPRLTIGICVVGIVVASAVRPLSRAAYAAAARDSDAREDTASHVGAVVAAGAEIAALGAREGALGEADQRIAVAETNFAEAQGKTRLAGTLTQSLAFVLASAGLFVLAVSPVEADFVALGTVAILLLRVVGIAQFTQSAAAIYRSMAPFIRQVRRLVLSYEAAAARFGDEPFPADFNVALEGISYRYPGAIDDAVRVDRAFLPQGQAIGIVGPSGSGKSTLIQLLLRLREPQEGRITIGSRDIRGIASADFARHVAYVPQSPTLVPGSIRQNIEFFRPRISREEVIEASKRAHVHDDILRMDDGYETQLDSHVDQLSGGQKQRLALARALAGSPSMIVLDEPTSALDPDNEQKVMETLASLMGRVTIVLVTHKLSTTDICDAVYRVERGGMRLVEPE